MKRIFLLLFLLLLPYSAFAVNLINSAVQYVDSVEYTAITAWPSNTAISAGQLTRQNAAPTLGNERVFAAIVAGTTTNGTEPTWTVTKGGKTTDNTVTWQEITGQPCVNGDTTNSPVWGASLVTTLGQIIYDSVTLSCQIVSTAGTTKTAPAPSFSATAGVTTTDNTVTWTSLGLASNFGAFAAPHKRILNADSGTWQTVVPAKIYIGNDHNFSQGALMSYSGGGGTAANQNQYISVSHTVAPPTGVTAGASESTTTTNTITFSGFGYFYGITFSAGTGSSVSNIIFGQNNAAEDMFFDNCTFTLANTTGAASNIQFGGTSINDSYNNYFISPTFTFGATAHQFLINGGNAIMVNASVAQTGSIPTTLMKLNSTSPIINLVIRDSDLSKITGTLLNLNSERWSGQILLEHDKLGAAVAMTTGSFANSVAQGLKVHGSDSGTKVYRFYETNYLGTIQHETTTVDNTNPASDGTTTISWNIATTANTSFGQPYSTEWLPISIWENTTGSSITPEIEIAGANSLTNADIWPECEILDNSGAPVGDAISGRAAPLATPSTWASSTDTWGGSPAHTQILSVTGTPQLKGNIKCRVFVAKPSITEYISPIIVNIGITSGRQYLVPGDNYINEGPSSGGSCGTIGHACLQ